VKTGSRTSIHRVLAVLVVVCASLIAGPVGVLGDQAGQLLEEPCSVDPLSLAPEPADLQPGVWEFIAGNYLSHESEYPDPNEPVEVLRLYLDGRERLRSGDTDAAVDLFTKAVAGFSDSRHAHAGLGWALWQRHQESLARDDLTLSVEQFLHADQLGMKYGRVHYSGPISRGLGLLRNVAGLDKYFSEAKHYEQSLYLVTLDYARGLALAGEAEAEEWFRKAVDIEPARLADAVAYLAEWLLDSGRPNDVVPLVQDGIQVPYVQFLKGVALEYLGRGAEAEIAYEQFRTFSEDFPAPARYRIEGSPYQRGIYFEGDILPRYSMAEAIAKLSRVISGEARGESTGQQRAVGWTVRTRVFLAYYVSTQCGGYGNPNGAWGALGSDQPLADRYYAICTAASQFAEYDATPSTDARASEVYYGSVPDPVTQACISGSVTGTWCDGSCSSSAFYGAFSQGPAWLHAGCPDYHPSSTCSQYRTYKPCGGSGNCFYRLR